jgi:hypothetical protein
MSRHGQSATQGNPQKHGAWKGHKPGSQNSSASQSRMWKCQGSGGCGYGWNNFSQACCQRCNASWQFDKRSPQRDGRPNGKADSSRDSDKVALPKTSPGESDSKPTSTRWGVWEWKWDGDASSAVTDPTVPVAISESQKLAGDIVALQKEIVQLQALLGEDHDEVTSRNTKLEALRTQQKENQPAMPHEHKLRKNLWEVRDCDVKLKKVQLALESSKLKTIAAQKEEDEAGEAIASVVKQRDEALAQQQNLLLLCKNGEVEQEPVSQAPVVQKEWAEGMAGLQSFMAVCQAMESSLSDEDKALLGTMQVIQNRMAQRTAVSDDEEEPDESMEDKGGGEKSARPDDDAGGKQSKKQCTEAIGLALGTQSPGSGVTPTGASASSDGVAGISHPPKHILQ